MAITTLDGLIAAPKQQIVITKTTSVVAAALPNNTTAIWHVAGDPGAGTLAVGNTANGVVPTDATAGFPVVNAFGVSASGYIVGIQASNSVASTLVLYDRLFHAGAYAFNAAVTLATIPSYSGRVPGGTDFTNTELWIEQVTAGTLVQNVAIGYTNQAGTATRTTGAVAAPAAMIVARMFPMPLQAGDSGVSVVNTVTGTVASAGTFNVVVMRRLATIRIPVANFSVQLGFDGTAMPQVFDTSALCLMVQPDSTASGLPYMNVTVANG
jgi:hypothetical protein